jgi:hypothetical protein
MTTIMFALSIPTGFIAGRWIMIAWPVGYLGLRLVAEYYIRRTERLP